MRKPILIAATLSLCLFLGGCAAFRPDRALLVATGTAAHDLCSETFVSGLDPDRVFAESLRPRPGFRLIAWAMQYEVDRENRQVRAWLTDGLSSRAVARDGFGCVLVHGNESTAGPKRIQLGRADALVPAIAGPAVVAPANPQLKSALDAAFEEPLSPPHRWTKAVVVMHDGKVVAERYADGYGVDTPILGFSISKSVVNAMVGILVLQGKLQVDQAAPIPEWRQPGDSRQAVTIEHLMRMTSGLDLDETGSGFDPSNQMFYVEPDMAAYAGRSSLIAPPGTRWSYSSASTHLLSRIVRDTAGEDAERVQEFAWRELFGPLGMQTMTMEMDVTGTPVGAHYMLASARDWARFGLLYLRDGVVGGKRILPAGWVNYSTTPTLNTDYGAGWWTNRRTVTDVRKASKMDMPLMSGVPPDAFYALGNLGQFVAVVPSARLVVVRIGRSHGPDFDIGAFEKLVAASITAIKQP